MTEKMYKVHNNNGTEDASEPKPKRRKAYITGGMYYIALRPAIKGEVQGEYWIYAHRDGAYTVLPCPPAPELKTVKMPLEMKKELKRLKKIERDGVFIPLEQAEKMAKELAEKNEGQPKEPEVKTG